MLNRLYLKIIFVLLFAQHCFSQVLIITSAYNRPDFIEMQYKTFKKFLKDDYTFVVFNDARLGSIRDKIKKKCNDLDIYCINVPQEIHDQPYLERIPGELFQNHSPAVRNCNVVQYALDTLGFQHDDIVIIIDSDMFLVREFSVREYLKNYHVSAWLRLCCDRDDRCRDRHPDKPSLCFMWIGLVFLDMQTMPNKKSLNFNCGLINGIDIDAGGYTYYYLRDNTDLRAKFFNKLKFHRLVCKECDKLSRPLPPCKHTSTEVLMDNGLDRYQIELFYQMPLTKFDRSIELFLDGTFIHYQAGSNYTNFSSYYHEMKTEVFKKYFDTILF